MSKVLSAAELAQNQAKRLALIGNPNCGKTALFNRLTGSQQKVANYAGVTVELKKGQFKTPEGKANHLLDLPGTYSLQAGTPDEAITIELLRGEHNREAPPEQLLYVLDATHMLRGLRFLLTLKSFGLPIMVALNMSDLAAKRGIVIDTDQLSSLLGMHVVATVATEPHGCDALLRALDAPSWQAATHVIKPSAAVASTQVNMETAHQQAQQIMADLGLAPDSDTEAFSAKVDRVLLHPLWGILVLLAVLFLMFQAVFTLAAWPMEWIELATQWLSNTVGAWLPEGMLKSLVLDGIIAGVGSVLIFLPQILILFFFILTLEESGYLPRAAFLLDRLMGGVGLSGRAFIPLLSSFACAIPGIMAARTVADPRSRWVTIMIAPLMTCSARLPVYALLISAFIPAREVLGGLTLQGLVLFILYAAGILSALVVAWVVKLFRLRQAPDLLLMELPDYHLPHARNIAIGLWQRAAIFIKRVGGIILALTIVLWFLSSFPAAPPDATQAAITYSLAGKIGQWMAPFFAPIGFNWQICIALIPGMAAREVAVSALATVYALSGTGAEAALESVIARDWSLATALSLLAWFVFAPQCLATIATVKRELGSWKPALYMLVYLFVLAYLASYVVYHSALALGW